MIEDIPTRATWLGEGRPPPEEGYKRVFHTPSGIYPKLTHVALKYGIFKSSAHRMFKNKSDTLKEWYTIGNPTEEQTNQAIINANTLYIAKYKAEDHCILCNAVDNLLFSEKCWLLGINHTHSTNLMETNDLINTSEAIIRYSFRGKDYKVSHLDWVRGKRVHLESTADTL
jgi:hypothetical protein